MEDHAEIPRDEPSLSQQEHPGIGTLSNEGRQEAQPPAERRDSILVEAGGSAERPSECVERAVATVLRLIPKGVAPPPETPVAFVEELLQRLKVGEAVASIGLVIHFVGGDDRHIYWRWGLSALEHVGLLTVATHDILRKEAT